MKQIIPLMETSLIMSGGGYKYWVKREDVEKQIRSHKNNFIICSEFKVAMDIKRNFLYLANCVILYVHCDLSTIRERMIKLDYTQDEVDFRVNRTKNLWGEFLSQSALVVQHTVLNSSTIEDLYIQIDRILDKYN